jgi:hypothetical protein
MWKLLAPGVGLGDLLTPAFYYNNFDEMFWVGLIIGGSVREQHTPT